MYNHQTLSVVMPAYNEELAVFDAVAAFKGLPEVDEVIVVDNNSTDQTAKLATAAGATVVHETKQGYGYASMKALRSAHGDLVLIVEPDGTFRPKDLYKLLQYADEFDAVIGTRTSKACIWAGANMGWFLRLGNVAVAKLLEYLHNGPCLTDVGCTLKMIRRPVLEQIEPYLTVGGSHFSPQLMIILVRTGMRCIEVPVHYRSRRGESKITGSLSGAARLGLRMIAMIMHYRFVKLPKLSSVISEDVLIDIGEHSPVNRGASTEPVPAANLSAALSQRLS
jgi:glycosyltransferase involved in cell wall biosynthesis